MSYRREEVRDERRESSSSQSQNYVEQPNDDAPPLRNSQNQHPSSETAVAKLAENQNQNRSEKEKLIAEFQRMLRLSKAQTLGQPVEQVDAPDRAITIQILEVFADGADAQKWVESTIRRGLARKSRSATWGIFLADAKNHETQIRLDRERAEEAEKERQLKRDREQALAAYAAAALDIPVPFPHAYEQIKREKGCHVPKPLRVRLRRIGELIAPNELHRQSLSWQECNACKDTGILGTALDRDLRFCGCLAGDEAKFPAENPEIPPKERLHKGPDWPAEEIARVHATTKSLLVEAYGELDGNTAQFIANMIESAEVVDDGKQITIHPAKPKDTEWLYLDVLYGVMSRVGLADRSVEVKGKHTAAFDPAKPAPAAPSEPQRKPAPTAPPEPERQTTEAAPPEPPQAATPEHDQRRPCAHCSGLGVLADGGFCDCSMGRDMQQLARYNKRQKKGPATEGQKVSEFRKEGETA
jgi:hypothetical protein